MEAGLNKTSLMRALFINVIQLTFNQNRNTDAFIMYAPAVEFFFFFFGATMAERQGEFVRGIRRFQKSRPLFCRV